MCVCVSVYVHYYTEGRILPFISFSPPPTPNTSVLIRLRNPYSDSQIEHNQLCSLCCKNRGNGFFASTTTYTCALGANVYILVLCVFLCDIYMCLHIFTLLHLKMAHVGWLVGVNVTCLYMYRTRALLLWLVMVVVVVTGVLEMCVCMNEECGSWRCPT